MAKLNPREIELACWLKLEKIGRIKCACPTWIHMGINKHGRIESQKDR